MCPWLSSRLFWTFDERQPSKTAPEVEINKYNKILIEYSEIKCFNHLNQHLVGNVCLSSTACLFWIDWFWSYCHHDFTSVTAADLQTTVLPNVIVCDTVNMIGWIHLLCFLLFSVCVLFVVFRWIKRHFHPERMSTSQQGVPL